MRGCVAAWLRGSETCGPPRSGERAAGIEKDAGGNPELTSAAGGGQCGREDGKTAPTTGRVSSAASALARRSASVEVYAPPAHQRSAIRRMHGHADAESDAVEYTHTRRRLRPQTSRTRPPRYRRDESPPARATAVEAAKPARSFGRARMRTPPSSQDGGGHGHFPPHQLSRGRWYRRRRHARSAARELVEDEDKARISLPRGAARAAQRRDCLVVVTRHPAVRKKEERAAGSAVS